ncbi:type VII secretion protein EssC [Furfurilactobacillus sp. WILCCON 0119]
MVLATKFTEATTQAANIDPNNMRLFVSNGMTMHAMTVRLNRNAAITFGTPATGYAFAGLVQPLTVSVVDGSLLVGNQPLVLGVPLTVRGMTYQLLPKGTFVAYDLKGRGDLVVGPHPSDDISLRESLVNFHIHRQSTGFELSVFSGDCFLNRQLVAAATVPMAAGDELIFDGVRVLVKEDYLQLADPLQRTHVKLAQMPTVDADLPDDYPNYHRSPRIIYRAPEEKVKIDEPQPAPMSPDNQLGRVILPPVLMAAMALIMTLVSKGNPVMILSMVGMSLATVVTSITAYFKGKKDFRVNSKLRQAEYDANLTKKTIALTKLANKQAQALLYHYPDMDTIQTMVAQVNSRIYEKTPLQHDFLTYRLGLGTVPASFSAQYEDDPFTKDTLAKEAMALKTRFQNIDNVPITTDLMHGPVGLVGQRELVIEQVQAIAMQLATFHSYHDLQFISIFPEAEKPKWDWMRWLPHATLQAMNVRGFIYHERSRDQILNSFYQILKDHDQQLKETDNGQEKLVFSPHYVVFMTHEELVLDHSIMEYFSKDLTELGVSMVFVEDVMQSLPEQVHTVIDIADYHTGQVVIEQGKLKNQRFVPDHFPVGFDAEGVARGLAALNHQETLKNSIPKAVTFMQMYDTQRVEDLNIGQRWQEHEPFKTLAVPLGERGKDDIVTLNLHEKADGPHGLIAGTTGSGKSELVQSYILSLSVNFRPNDVGFLLIDYKGGGMANLFRNLPHLLGAITNLDGAQSMRALDSIKAELQRRQRLFSQFNVNHINQYQRLFNEGTATEPMPHLFLISDEFAELKTGQPEFMKELVSTARIGRSLGIHLILATQKPTGVVDDQIWSNSKFKISLKVQDKADSNEILHTPDAASIVEPGRAYLQVGNNEKYELFQSAWSGADYNPDQEIQHVDQTVYAINELGQYEVLTQDLSGDDDKNAAELQKRPSELEAVIDYIHDYAQANNIKRLPRPWLPPLGDIIAITPDATIDYHQAWQGPLDVKVAVGTVDIPSQQAQKPLFLDLNENSHTAVIGSAGYGKSTFLQTMIMQLARQNNPEQLNVYLLDFGTNGLLPLQDLPHVADIIRVDETEKLAKLLTRLDNDVKTRKRLLNRAGVATLDQYREATGEQLPVIEVVIDNYDAVRDSPFEDPFESMMNTIAREGASIGIFLLISANRQGAFRMQMTTNLKTQIALYLIDASEVTDVVGRTKLTIEDLPGRGMVKLDEPRVFQTFEPCEAEDALHVLEAVKNEAGQMANDWTGEVPEEIPMVPDEFTFDEFKERKAVKAAGETMMPLGLKLSDTLPIGLDFERKNLLALIFETEEQIEAYHDVVIKGLQAQSKANPVMYFGDDDDAELYQDTFALVVKPANYRTVLDNLLTGIQTPSSSDNRTIVYIKDMMKFIEQVDLTDNEAEILFKQAGKAGYHLIIGVDRKDLENAFVPMMVVLKNRITIGIIGSRMTDQQLINVGLISNEAYPSVNEGYYFSGRNYEKVSMPKN